MRGFSRKLAFAVSHEAFAERPLPEMWRRIESVVYPRAKELGLVVSRAETPLRAKKQSPESRFKDVTWKARQGRAAGYTVRLIHNRKNAREVTLKATPFYPYSYLTAFAVGVIASYFWMPFILDNFLSMLHNWLFGAAMLVTLGVFFLFVHEHMVAVVLTVLTALAFGFIAGYAAGWELGKWIGDQTQGRTIRPILSEVLGAVESPGGAPTLAAGRGLFSLRP